MEGEGGLEALAVGAALDQHARQAVAMKPKKMRGGPRCSPPRRWPRHGHVARVTRASGLPALAKRTARAEGSPIRTGVETLEPPNQP